MNNAALAPVFGEWIAERTVVDPSCGCWRWTGAHDRDGYGLLSANRRTYRAHRYVYAQIVGPIGDKLVLDHVKARGCQHRDCVNPDHLEPVTVEVNSKRVVPWNRLKTHCPAGHDYAETGVYYECRDGCRRRFCTECARERRARKG